MYMFFSVKSGLHVFLGIDKSVTAPTSFKKKVESDCGVKLIF